MTRPLTIDRGGPRSDDRQASKGTASLYFVVDGAQ
jgi:hypothetical protein